MKTTRTVFSLVASLFAAAATLYSQSYQTILDDPLAGSTRGKRTGGSFVAGGGWQVIDKDNMIVYDLGQYVESGSLELDVRNFNPKIQNSMKRHHFLAMFCNPWGTHHPAENLETVWDLHAGKRYAPGIKVLSWTYDENESVTELPSPAWSANRTYHLKITWQGKELQYYRDGVLYARHEHSETMQLRFLFLGRDLTVSGDLKTNYKNNQYPALVGPIYANLVIKRAATGDDAEAPVVSAIAPSALYANAARLSWVTDEPAACRVEYGLSPDFENSTAVLGMPATTHETTLAGLAANQTYDFRIIAQDKEGNVTVTENYSFTTAAGGKYLFKPVADAFVEADGIYGPMRSYGNFGWMHLLLSSGRQCYLRFEVAGISGKIIDAALRLHGRQSGSGGDVEMLGTNWDELGVTWRKKPTIPGPKVGNLPAISAGEWSEVSVISAVNGNATYNFAITGFETQVASLDSRESMNFHPELVVTTSDESTIKKSLATFSVAENSTLGPGLPGSWDENIRERGWFMYENGTYHAWYGGWSGEYDHNVPKLVKLGYAYSTDGINWTKYPGNPIYDQTWIEDVCVVKSDSVYYMYAEDEYTGNGENVHVVLYTSSDRINWAKHGIVLEHEGNGWESLEAATPTVWKEDSLWHMLYEGIGYSTAGQIGLATSTDGINWTRYSNNPILANPLGTDRDIAIDSIIKVNGVYYAYGHYFVGSQKWVAGVFTSCNLTSWTMYPDNLIPCSSPVIVDNGSDYFLFGPDFSGRAPFKLSFGNQTFETDSPVSCPPQNYDASFDNDQSAATEMLPQAHALKQNYPNPFNPQTQIEYALPEPGGVRLSIFDLLGREVAVLVAGHQPAGRYQVIWDGRDGKGQRVSSGIYFYHLRAGEYAASRKMLLAQ